MIPIVSRSSEKCDVARDLRPFPRDPVHTNTEFFTPSKILLLLYSVLTRLFFVSTVYSWVALRHI